jgi:hypothetical protein
LIDGRAPLATRSTDNIPHVRGLPLGIGVAVGVSFGKRLLEVLVSASFVGMRPKVVTEDDHHRCILGTLHFDVHVERHPFARALEEDVYVVPVVVLK